MKIHMLWIKFLQQPPVGCICSRIFSHFESAHKNAISFVSLCQVIRTMPFYRLVFSLHCFPFLWRSVFILMGLHFQWNEPRHCRSCRPGHTPADSGSCPRAPYCGYSIAKFVYHCISCITLQWQPKCSYAFYNWLVDTNDAFFKRNACSSG